MDTRGIGCVRRPLNGNRALLLIDDALKHMHLKALTASTDKHRTALTASIETTTQNVHFQLE